MAETTTAPQWDMLGFTRVVADALDDSVASFLRAQEDSVHNVVSTRARMEAAQGAYLQLRVAQDMMARDSAACRTTGHVWGPPHVVPSVPVEGVERDPKFVTFEVCGECRSLKVKTSNTGDRADWTSQYILRK